MARLGSMTLVIPLVCAFTSGCPGDAGGPGGSAETGAVGGRDSTTGEDPSTDDSSTPADTAASEESGSESTAGTCGGQECGDDESCVDGVCTPDRPPATCDAPVSLSDPECETCVAESCCELVQACVGDGTGDEPTPCATLLGCIHQNCLESEDQAEFDACLQDNCADTVAELEVFGAASQCVSECLVVSPGREVTCGLEPL